MKSVRLSYHVLHLQEPGNAPSDVLLLLLLIDIPDTMLRPDCNFGGFFVFWDLYGLIGFHGKKRIYSGVLYPVVHANGVAGSNTAYVGRARKCQHITEYAGRLTGATHDFDNFYLTALAGRSSASSLVWEPLGKGSITLSCDFLGDLSLLGTFLTVPVLSLGSTRTIRWWPGRGGRHPLLRSNGVKFLAKSISHRRHLPCGIFRVDSSMALRVDAHATETEASVGGWLPVKGVDGATSVWDSFWFMLKVTPESHPWAFLRKGVLKRVNGALEAYAALLAIKASWIPRELDVEADRLSNMDGSGFDPTKRIPVESSDLSWHILEDALRWGSQLQRVRCARGPNETVSRTLGEVKFLHTAQTVHEP